MSVPSICSTRALRTEATASSLRKLCSPSGPKLTKSNFSTHPGSCCDLGCSAVELKPRFIERSINRGSEEFIDGPVGCLGPNGWFSGLGSGFDQTEEQKHITRLLKMRSFLSELEIVRRFVCLFVFNLLVCCKLSRR